jgi:hypothetical protein
MKKYLFFAVITAITLSSCSRNTTPNGGSKKFVIGTGDGCLDKIKTGPRSKRDSRH